VAKCRHGKLRLRWTRAHPETSRQRHYGNTQLLRRRLHRRRYKLPLRSRPPRLHCGAYRYRKRPVVSRRDFSPFGIVRNESGSVQADFAYTGHFYDPELALHHSPTRVYDAGLGRWLSADIFPDAELLPEGTNLYAYVGNDPINFTDPLGLCRSSSNRNQANRPPPKQSGNSGSSGGNPPKKTASSASPQDGGGGSNASVRSSYKESFAKWQKYADTMQARGSSIEHIAKRVSNARLAARSRYQKMTPLTTRLSIYARNLTPKWVPARFPIGGKWFKPGGYGNPVGPSWKSLRSQGKSWNEILKSSLRANKN